MARKEAAAKRKAEGGRQISMSLTGEEAALLDRLRESGRHGTNKATIVAALNILAGRNDLTRDDVMDWLERHLPG